MSMTCWHNRVSTTALHVTFFDLADAFGIHQSHIDITLHETIYVNTSKHNSICWNALFPSINGSVCGPGWTSNNFKFRRGTFQGDPLSPIIFLMCFNPILEYLENIRNVHGFNLDGDKVITKPYADDFNLITSNKVQHQKIINDLPRHRAWASHWNQANVTHYLFVVEFLKSSTIIWSCRWYAHYPCLRAPATFSWSFDHTYLYRKVTTCHVSMVL